MTEGQLTNGHDKSADEDALPWEPFEAAQAAIVLRAQITELQISAARQAERVTVEALVQDAMRRYVEAMKAGNHRLAVEATREILRLEIYLSRRGFV
jgi:spore germination protein YaaH